MKVGLYASQLAPGGPTGIHRYVSELTGSLFDAYPERYRLIASAEATDPTWLPSGISFTRLPGPRRALHLAWFALGRPRIERFAGRLDVLHVLYPTFPVATRASLVYTLHDVQHLEDPESYSPREVRLGAAALHQAADHADRIITVSGQVAGEAAARLGIDQARIRVVHHGVAERFRTPPSREAIARVCGSRGIHPGGYFLYVGKVETRKNLATLLKAMARREAGLPLVVAGPAGLGAERIAAEIDTLGLADRVRMLGHVDADLAPLMAGALALVHPSRYESFGLPPLEAMALGTAVVASRAGALPEVLGDAAILLDPDDVDAWAEALSKVAADHGLVDRLAKEGLRHSAAFTWERAARETAAVHEELVRA